MAVQRADLHLTTARWLLFIAALGIIYGSLYPFRLSFGAISFDRAISILVDGWRGELGIPNIFSNIVLFIPYGLFGSMAFASMPRASRWLLVYGSSALLAIGLQIAQLWLGGRTPTIADAVINMGGVVIGVLLARIPMLRSAILGVNIQANQVIAIPVMLMLSWLAYRWFPFVPTLDVTAVKEGLKPLLLQPELRPLSLFHNLVAWLVFAVLWQQCRFREGLLWLVIPAAVLAQAGIADNPLTLHNVLAAILAPPLWFVLNRIFARPVGPVVLLLILMLFIQGLRPFELESSSFKWIPFTGFLTGNMMINLVSLLEKLFLYGSLVWLTLEASQSRATGLLIPVLVTAAIEAAQTRIAGRVAEITDPLLCLAIWSIAILTWQSVRDRSEARKQAFGREETAVRPEAN